MSTPSISTPSLFARALLLALRASSLLVPRVDRQSWLREWTAEILHTATTTTRFRLIARVAGAPIDAVVLRITSWGLSELRFGWLADIRDAARALRKAPLQTATIVACLAIGSTLTVLVFGIINAMVGGALPGIRDRGELVRMRVERPDGRSGSPLVADMRAMPQDIQGLTGWGVEIGAKPFSVSAGDQGGIADGAFVSGNYFGVLGTKPVIGRLLGPGDDRPDATPVAVIGYHFWQRRYGGRDDAIGQSMQVATATYQIVGVAPPGFTGIVPSEPDEPTGEHGNIWLPISQAAIVGNGVENLINSAAVVLRLNRGETAATVEPQLQRFVAVFNNARQAATTRPLGESYTATAVRLSPLNFLPGDEDEPLTNALIMAGLAAIPSIILGIGCANVAGIQLARAIGRTHELAVRVSLGANRIRIVRLLAIETAFLAATATAIGWFGAKELLRLAGPVLPLAPLADVRLLATALALPIGVTLVAGFLPAWRATGFDVTSGLRLGPRVGRTASPRMRRIVVAGQVGLSFALLIAAGTLVRALTALPAAIGPAPDDVLMAEVRFWDLGWQGARESEARAEIIARVKALNGVEAIGFSPRSVFVPPWRGGDGTCGASAALVRFATPGFFEVLGLQMQQGRAIRAGDDRNVVIVNETFARGLPNPSAAVGSTITISREKGMKPSATIVGVVKDNYERFPNGTPRPLCWSPWNVETSSASAVQAGYLTLFVRSHQARELVAPIRTILRDLDPRLAPAEIGTLSELLPTHNRVLFGISTSLVIASVIALGLAAVGLFGVIAYGAAQRTHEFGVRLAFGARPRDIARVLLRESIVVMFAGAIVGIALASPAVWFLSQGLTTVRLADPVLAGGALAILAGVSFAAAIRPMRRAVRIDPVTALRAE